jgi:hypothetical protein
MIESGIPYGSKRDVRIPQWARNSKHFWRGVIDGDGSLGITKTNRCFLSLVTKSEHVAQAFGELLKSITGKHKEINRNKRDAVFNITIFIEDAKKVIEFLGYNDTNITIPRKKQSALDVLSWVRPSNMKEINFARKKWTPEEDAFILNHSLPESVSMTRRTEKSIKIRLWRLAS